MGFEDVGPSQNSRFLFKKKHKKTKKQTNFMAPFYGWGSTASRLEPL